MSVARHTIPFSFGLIKEVHNVEGVRVFRLEGVKLRAEENVLLRDVGKEEFELGLVGLVSEGIIQDLVEGGTMTLVISLQYSGTVRSAYMPVPPPMNATSSNSFTNQWVNLYPEN